MPENSDKYKIIKHIDDIKKNLEQFDCLNYDKKLTQQIILENRKILSIGKDDNTMAMIFTFNKFENYHVEKTSSKYEWIYKALAGKTNGSQLMECEEKNIGIVNMDILWLFFFTSHITCFIADNPEYRLMKHINILLSTLESINIEETAENHLMDFLKFNPIDKNIQDIKYQRVFPFNIFLFWGFIIFLFVLFLILYILALDDEIKTI
jgi:hypothetical protein